MSACLALSPLRLLRPLTSPLLAQNLRCAQSADICSCIYIWGVGFTCISSQEPMHQKSKDPILQLCAGSAANVCISPLSMANMVQLSQTRWPMVHPMSKKKSWESVSFCLAIFKHIAYSSEPDHPSLGSVHPLVSWPLRGCGKLSDIWTHLSLHGGVTGVRPTRKMNLHIPDYSRFPSFISKWFRSKKKGMRAKKQAIEEADKIQTSIWTLKEMVGRIHTRKKSSEERKCDRGKIFATGEQTQKGNNHSISSSTTLWSGVGMCALIVIFLVVTFPWGCIGYRGQTLSAMCKIEMSVG